MLPVRTVTSLVGTSTFASSAVRFIECCLRTRTTGSSETEPPSVEIGVGRDGASITGPSFGTVRESSTKSRWSCVRIQLFWKARTAVSPSNNWWARRDSNPGLPACERSAPFPIAPSFLALCQYFQWLGESAFRSTHNLNRFNR